MTPDMLGAIINYISKEKTQQTIKILNIMEKKSAILLNELLYKMCHLDILLQIKLICIVCVNFILLFSSCSDRKSSIYARLEGEIDIDYEYSSWKRFSNYSLGPVLEPMNFQKDSVVLPKLFCVGNNASHVRQIETVGSWEIIHESPDSIIINASNHPFSGKYLVEFKRQFILNKLHYYVYLTNDSTRIIGEKYFLFAFGIPKIAEHWED